MVSDVIMQDDLTKLREHETEKAQAGEEYDPWVLRLVSEIERLRRHPRTIYVKVSTDLLAALGEWSEPVRVKVERDWNDDTFELIFKREEAS